MTINGITFNDEVDKPHPKTKMTTYQLSLKGWDGATGDRDDLVRWVNARKKQTLVRAIKASRWELDDTGVDVIGPFMFVDGVCSIAEEGYLLGDPEPEPKFGCDEGEDKAAGCGCGVNCDRSAGDPCPLDELKALAERRHISNARLRRAGIQTWHTLDETIEGLWKDDFHRAWTTLCAFGPKISTLQVVKETMK